MITNEEIARAAVQCTCVCCSSLRQALLAHLDAKDAILEENTQTYEGMIKERDDIIEHISTIPSMSEQQLKISLNTWRELHRVATDEIKRLNEQVDNQRQTIETYQRKIDDIADLVA